MSQSNLNNSVKELINKAKSSGSLGNSSSLSGVAVSNNQSQQFVPLSQPSGLFPQNLLSAPLRSANSGQREPSPIPMRSLSNSLSTNSTQGSQPSSLAPSFQNPLASNQSQVNIPGLFSSSQNQNNSSQSALSQQSTQKLNPLTNYEQSVTNTNPLMASSNSQSSFGISGLFPSSSMPSQNSTLSSSQVPIFNVNQRSKSPNKQYESFPISNSGGLSQQLANQSLNQQNLPVSSKLDQLKSLASQQKENQSASARLSQIVSPDENTNKPPANSSAAKIEELRRIASNSATSALKSSMNKQEKQVEESKTNAGSLLSEMKNQLEPSSKQGSSFGSGTSSATGSLSVADKIKKLREQSSSIQSTSSSLSKNRANSPARSVGQNMEQSQRRPSRNEEQFIVPDVVSSELNNKEEPKVTGKEDVLAPHMAVFKKYGITIDKIFNDKDSDVIYLDAYTRIGVNFVIEIANRKGVTLYLNDGHVLEKHTGEEFDLSKKILQEECEALGTCGLFSQSGDKLVVASKKHGAASVHKTSYIVTTVDSEKSLIENGKVVSLPVVQFEQLEQDEACVQELMLLVDTRYHEYCKRAADETLMVLKRALVDLDSARSACAAYVDDNSIANQNFEYRHGIALKNFAYYASKNDEESIGKVAAGRKELFDDLQKTVAIGRELSKSIEHASKVKALVDEKLENLRRIGVKYI